jgi:uncharacterized protein
MVEDSVKQRRKPKRRTKHVPVRTCVACREKDAKREYVRIVRTPDDQVVIDPTGKLNGRGAYLCKRRSCWDLAAASNVLDRALKTSLDEQTRSTLRTYADRHYRSS